MTTPLCIRAGQLVRLLSSDRPGEAGAAAQALCRTISAAGRDIFWLANVVAAALEAPLVPAEASDEDVSWEEALEIVIDHIDEPDPRSRAFIWSLSKWRGEPSERQQQWLMDLFARVHRGRR